MVRSPGPKLAYHDHQVVVITESRELYLTQEKKERKSTLHSPCTSA